MMPHIIYLLLIASSPISTLGDGPESWGSVPSGPSESECRPFIEKALQGASIHESPEQQTGIDDVGDTGGSEGSGAPSEASENQPSEIPSDEEREELSEPQVNQQDVETETREKSSGEDETKESDLRGSEASNESQEEMGSAEVPSEQSEELETNEPVESSKNEETQEQSDENKSDEIQSDTENETIANESDETIEIASAEDVTKEITTPSDDDQTPEEPEVSSEGEEQHDRTEEVQQYESSEEPLPEGTEALTSQETLSPEETEASTSQETLNPDETDPDNNKGTSEEDIAESITQPEEQGSSVEEEGDLLRTASESTDSDAANAGASEEQLEEESIPEQESNESSPPNKPNQETSANVEGTSSEETKEEDSAVSKEAETEGEPAQLDGNVGSVENARVEEGDSVPSDETSESNLVLPENEPAENRTESDENLKEEGRAAVEEEIAPSSEEPAPKQEEEVAPEEPVAQEEAEASEESAAPEEELSMIIEVPEKLRSREHMTQILLLNEENEERENLLSKTIDNTLRELKKLYDNAIKPLEILYKYRDLSNRHFGDPEIFSKPLILFMGPWSGGKSTIINYLLENEYKKTALRSGAEPSPAYFNIVMWGEGEEVLDGTQLAADWTFSGLQKFGQGLLDRLRGLKLSHPLLKKVNIVEIPGILEIRKQVERLFPFNDACQWFIDRADIIFLVYDPSKLDVGPETEAILDQLKGREMQTRIILNKADQVKPEELMRVQGTLIWNISPLMSSTEPPVMYSTSLWSLPYEVGAPTRLLHAQERAFLKDLRDAIDKRVENKIASARRFAVRVRNHAKMVDCYLTTYYNHKSFFGNKKKISDDIIEHPQNYHIYEGLSTLTNISRYDLPDPDVYRDFFRLNPVYEFQQLSSTCTYFRGCPINRLDVAIAYDLPELVGKYKKQTEEVLNSGKK